LPAQCEDFPDSGFEFADRQKKFPAGRRAKLSCEALTHLAILLRQTLSLAAIRMKFVEIPCIFPSGKEFG
jgi:hypothetical protein